MDTDYVALIGDLVASRKSPARASIQTNLGRWLTELNGLLGPQALAAPLIQTAGDEIQGLFRQPERIVEVIQVLRDRLHGAPGEDGSRLWEEMRFGIGRGPVSTTPPPAPPRQLENAALVDGPCFHRARAALDRVDREGHWVVFTGFDERTDLVLTSLFDLMHAIRTDWTTTQAVYTYHMRDKETQRELASWGGVTPAVISKSLKAAHYTAIIDGEKAAQTVLASWNAPEPWLSDRVTGES